MSGPNTYAIKEMAAGFFNGFENGVNHYITLASTLSYLLKRAEKLFGSRDKNYTFVGIEYRKNGGPQIMYSVHDNSHVMINLSNDARLNLNTGLVELAHEVVHLLGPRPSASGLVIEEGCAAMFARDMSKEFGWKDSSDPNYEAAMELVRSLLTVTPDAIVKLRPNGGHMYAITKQEIKKVSPDLKEETAAMLAMTFSEFCKHRKEEAQKAPRTS